MLVKSNGPYTLLPSEHKWKILKDPSVAMLYGSNWKLNILTGEKTHFNCDELLEVLDLDTNKRNRILHLSYEAGFLFNKAKKCLKDNDWLALDLHYEIVEFLAPLQKKNIHLKNISTPSVEEYEDAFDKGYEYLRRGDSYQFNLTFPFKYSYEGDFTDVAACLYRKKENQGQYAHGTYIPSMSWGILSNSPECLFNQTDNFIETKPIKGTIKDEPGAWKKLSSSKKDQAELFMITDLLRNDLNRIEPLAKIKMIKAPLKVPGLLHQYSHITLETEKKIPVSQVTRSLFPGGSITGAPKIRTIDLLHEIEGRSRGAYCGSTYFFDDEQVRASINIRTAEVKTDSKEIYYGAGGGITILSEKTLEYREMLAKVDSFTLLLQHL